MIGLCAFRPANSQRIRFERNQRLQVAVSLRALFKREQWLRDHVRSDP